MRIRKSPLVVGALFVAGTAFAQADTTRRPTSTQRIPLSKEPVSQPMVSRVDTVTMYRTDTVTQYRTDTVTVTRVDTVTTSTSAGVVEMPAMLRQIGGFYIGVDGGAAVPQGDAFTNSQGTGWHVDVPFGWDPIGSPIGVRFAAGYSRFNKRGPFETMSATPSIFQGDADLKLRLPVTSAWTHRFQIYGVGGATYNRFRSIAQFNTATGVTTIGDNAGTVTVNNGIPTTIDDSWHSAWGWNAGGGIQFGFSRTNLFVESRYVHFGHNGDLNQIPIVVGLSWY